MNDDDLKRILRRGGRRQELPADVADRVQADMHDELDRTLGIDKAGIPLHFAPSSSGRRPRLLVRVAAAVLLVAATAGLLLSQRGPDVNEADPAQEMPTPPQQPFLVACLDFIESTNIGERPWHDTLAGPAANVPADYTATLATEIGKLLATSPDVSAATSQLQAAAAEARSADPDLDLIIRQLETAQDILLEETFVRCLTASNPDQPSD